MNRPTCNFLMTIEGVQRECGSPATHTLNQLTRAGWRLYYCDPHAHHVRTVGKRDVRELRPEELSTTDKH